MFGQNKCLMIDAATRKVIGTGETRQGLYYLKNEKRCLIGQAVNGSVNVENAANETKGNEYTMWHQRLGHASLSRLQHIDRVKPFLSQHKNQVCITCPLSKMTRISFPTSDSHAMKAFELLHSDIWGPYKVNTRGKFRFFLTLVDDYSRVTWVYLLEKKSDYLGTLIKFENYIENQYKGKLRIIRSDNALEFADREFKE